MPQLRSPQSLPIGLDLGTSNVSLVSAHLVRGVFVVRHALTVPIVPLEGTLPDRAIAEAIRALVATVAGRERRCILAAPQSDVVTRVFRVPPGMSRGEAERAAALEADGAVPWPNSERLVALDPIPGHPRDMLLSIARHSSIERRVAIARAAGLRPVAVDAPLCAWRRAANDADALLDCSSERATLAIFGAPIGTMQQFAPRLIDERMIAQMRAAFVDARRDGVADVQSIAVIGDAERHRSIAENFSTEGYAVRRLELGNEISPTWALAYGLATWSIAPRGVRAA